MAQKRRLFLQRTITDFLLDIDCLEDKTYTELTYKATSMVSSPWNEEWLEVRSSAANKRTRD